MRNILIGLGIGIPALIALAWIVATIGEGRVVLGAAVFVALFFGLLLARWVWTTVSGVGRWAKKQ